MLKQVKRQFQLLCLVMFLSLQTFAVYAAEGVSCSEALAQNETRAVLRSYKEVWNKKGIYCTSRCHVNVVKLFNAIQRRVPNLEPKDFKVLYITNKEGWLHKEVDRFNPLQARGFENGEAPFWKFHVALEYKGFVLDLDNSNQAKAYPKKRYVRDFFATEEMKEYNVGLKVSSKDLVVYVIPGDEYLGMPREIYDSVEFHEDILDTQKPTPLLSYGAD